MSIGYDSAKFRTITSVSELMEPAVQERGRPERQPDAGQRGAQRRHDGRLASGGSADDISKGVDFFHQLKQAGNFVPVQATPPP